MFQMKWRRWSKFYSRTTGRKPSPGLHTFFKPRCEALEERTLLSFADFVSYGTGSGPAAAVLGDFNGDNKPDIAVANSSATNISILLNSGTGTFGAASSVTVGLLPSSIAKGYF